MAGRIVKEGGSTPDAGERRITDALTEGGFLHKQKIGRSNYYVNLALYAILTSDDSP